MSSGKAKAFPEPGSRAVSFVLLHAVAVFARLQFERLEPEGLAREGKFVSQAVKLARKPRS